MYNYDVIATPIGKLLLLKGEKGLKQILFEAKIASLQIPVSWQKNSKMLKNESEQILAYFNCRLTQFDLKLDPDGTDFQQLVWKQLTKIPFGSCQSYSNIAQSIHQNKACRAVGMANSKNPIPIVIPCHRVIGKNGKLTGYAGGLEIKSHLLHLEGILKSQEEVCSAF